MHLRNLISFSIFILTTQTANAQADVCECCSYSSLDFKIDYDDFFVPPVIQKNKIKTLIVYTQGLNDSLKIKTGKYQELKFMFDAHGRVISRTEYNQPGQPRSIHEFERDGAGKVLKESSYSLDSLEQKETEYSPEITDHSYDAKGRLIKSKERSFEGRVVPDNQAMLTKNEYDEKGRKTMETRQYYYGPGGPETSIYITTYKYNDSQFEGTWQTFIDKKLWITSKTLYTSKWKVSTEIIHGAGNKKQEPASETRNTYDKAGRLISHKVTSGGLSECPDKGTYADTYEYNDQGLLTKITHQYGTNICTMTFEYK